MSDLTSKQQLEEVERLRVRMTQAILAETGLIVDIDCNIFYHDQPTQDLVTAAQELGWKREKHDGGLITIGSQPIGPKTTVFSITHRE